MFVIRQHMVEAGLYTVKVLLTREADTVAGKHSL
jgi:hypothetical protein